MHPASGDLNSCVCPNDGLSCPNTPSFWRFEFVCLPAQTEHASPANPLWHLPVCYMYSGECTVLANFLSLMRHVAKPATITTTEGVQKG
jgi:hypothetical protein